MQKSKIFLLSLLLVMVVLLVACKNQDISILSSEFETEKNSSIVTNVNSDNYNTFDDVKTTYKKDENFEIYTNHEQTMFLYEVYDKNHNLIDQGYHDWRGSFDISYRGNLLVLDYGYGGNLWSERYYDVKTGNVSRFFNRPIATSDNMVAYYDLTDNNKAVLIIQNIFDSTKYYKVIEKNFSSLVFTGSYDAEFLEKDTKFKLSYPSAENDTVITEIIELY